MECDSDSELHATDTLRLDSDSEDDPPEQTNIICENNDSLHKTYELAKDDELQHAAEVPDPLQNVHKLPGTPDDGNDDSDVENMASLRKQARKAKILSIVDSDSDEGQSPLNVKETVSAQIFGVASIDRLKSLVDSDSSTNEEIDVKEKNKSKKRVKKSSTNRHLGSFSESEEEQSSMHKIDSKESKRKRKKNIDKATSATTTVRTAKDMLASLNLFFDDDDDDEDDRTGTGTGIDPNILDNSSSQDECVEDYLNRKNATRKMSAKEAMDDKRIIQSESQRMAREMYIDVPYHRTKVYTFEEFLARKTICKPDPVRDCVGKPTASNLSIRMTADELEAFEKQLKERELESQAFFKSEGDSSCDEGDTAEIQSLEKQNVADSTCLDVNTHENVTPESIVPETLNDRLSSDSVPTGTDSAKLEIEKVIATDGTDQSENRIPLIEVMPSTMESIVQETCTDTEVNYDLFQPGLPDSAISAKKSTPLETQNVPSCPKLSGNVDMLIDLESGTLTPKQPSGVDILFQRLARCNVQKNVPTARSVSILSTADGVVKLNKVSLFAEEKDAMMHKEPTPGAAFLKLKQALKEQIDNNRRASMRKRDEEFAKKMEMEKAEKGDVTDEEEEEEELLEDDDEESENEQITNAAGQQRKFMDDEAEDCDDDAADDEENSSSDSDEDDDESLVGSQHKGKKIGRIVKAFEDSDDETLTKNISENLSNQMDGKPSSILLEGHNIPTENSSRFPETQEAHLWKHDQINDSENAPEDELMALCSGRFATQVLIENSQPNQQPSQYDHIERVEGSQSDVNEEPLFTQGDQLIRDSQLMDLCSGRFETQATLQDEDIGKQQPESTNGELALDDERTSVGRRLCLDSSDDETECKEMKLQKKKKKRKSRHLNISDDEQEEQEPGLDTVEQNSDIPEENNGGDVDDEDMEEDERYVDYDSEENEVHVKLTKKDKERMTARFVENEAELSESEWGSADEDEQDLDRYDIEVADEEQYNQKELQQELEKIHNRQMLDQDNRELELLKEVYLEDAEKDGAGRVRQFRWKNVEKTFSLDYDKSTEATDDAEGAASDEETELHWRKLRHERNLLLKEKNIALTDLTVTTLLNPSDVSKITTDGQENPPPTVKTPSMLGKKKITIVRKNHTATLATAREDSPFLISSSTVVQGHRASFLSRDPETLNKLADLIKFNPETEGSSTVSGAKARNFVFTALSPAIVKSTKRSLDPEDAEENGNIKKAKTTGSKKKKLLLSSLM